MTHKIRISAPLAGLAAAALLAVPMFGQTGMPDDWTHHSLVFSNPGSLNDAAANGRLSSYFASAGNLRNQLQQLKRNSGNKSTANLGALGNFAAVLNAAAAPKPEKPKPEKPTTMQRDWNVGLGAAPPSAMYPAKFGFDPNAAPSCTNDFIVYPVNVSGTQANLIAFTNLYVPGLCGTATTPNFKFAYKIGTGVIQTSPVLSLDGTQIAFVESISSGSKFHVLTIGTATEGSSTTGVVPGTSPSNAVDTSVTMSGNVSVTRSSPFPDYAGNAYVGDDSGKLHKFTGVFSGTLAECVGTNLGGACGTGTWPLSVGASTILTGPDVNGSNIYVGGANGNLYCVTTVGALCSPTSSISVTATAGKLLDPPIIDGSTGYVFVAAQNASNSILVQVSGNLSSEVTVTMGPQNPTYPVHNGAFDNLYLTGAPNAGFMYFCGVDSGGKAPSLYRAGFTNSAGLINSTNDGTVFLLASDTGSNDGCSPLSEISNPNTPGGAADLLFVAIAQNQHGCGSLNKLCVGSLVITSGMPAAFKSTFQLTSADTSAIVVDNVADVVPPWLASTTYPASSLIVDSNGNIQKSGAGSGTSGNGSHPTWSMVVGNTTTDNSVTWTMQGPYTGSWQKTHTYAANAIITDGVLASGQFHLWRTTAGGTSGATQPTFASSPQTDGGVTWTTLGPYTPSGVSSVYLSDVAGKLGYKFTQAGLR